MTPRAQRSNWWTLGLMLLSVILLFVAPSLPAAAMPKSDCCGQMPCHQQDKKAPCAEACALACQVLVAPQPLITAPAEIGSAAIAILMSSMPPGRALAPEPPPPR